MIEFRERWANRFVFVTASIGTAIGLGNVWRFPNIVYENGGGAFLIPYLIALFTTGIPLMILEFTLGHKFQKAGPAALASIRKNWEWVGWLGVLVGAVIMLYYTVILAWSLDYVWYSLTIAWDGRAHDFFFKELLQVTHGPGILGGLSWPVVVGLAISWIAMYFIIANGVKSVGKVVLFTVPLPIFLIALMVIRGLTLPGAMDGIAYYLTPDFSKLADPRVWLAAYSQVFFSLSLGFAILIAYASYLPRDAEIGNNAFITSLADAGLSYFSGFAVFSTLGFLAHAQGIPVKDLVLGGPILAFVTYPTAISMMGKFAVLAGLGFFIMLFTIGIDSAFSIVEAVLSAFHDKFEINRKRLAKGICLFGFLLGLIFATGSGLHWLDIVDHWFSDYGLTLVGFLECLLIGWFVSTEEFREYADLHSEIRIGKWWTFSIRYLSPAVLGTIILFSLITEFSRRYGGYPQWALWVGGWCLLGGIILAAFWLAKFERGGEGLR